jgi:hypothetical protein
MHNTMCNTMCARDITVTSGCMQVNLAVKGFKIICVIGLANQCALGALLSQSVKLLFCPEACIDNSNK